MLTLPWADALTASWFLFVAYFVLSNGSYILFGLVSGWSIRTYLRTRTRRNVALTARVASPPMVSIVMPAHNEALTIVESVRALLALDYEPREVVVVNDGSSDDTLGMLQRTFRLLAAPVAFVQPLASARVRETYRSVSEPALVVIDKENGGKADALNAGINAAAGVLVLTIDADTVIDRAALRRAVLPFLEDRTTVAVGGYVTVANGCLMQAGRITDVRLPHSWLARFQVVEYIRGFLLFRTACASVNVLTLVSGAFGLFHRDAVVAIGGYDRTAIGEDLDLTLRLHHSYRARREPFRIVFDPFPLCSTQVPEDWASLRAQRFRWRRGLLQALWRHRRMIGNPRFGLLGVGALPYVTILEVVGPPFEILCYVTIITAAIAGVLDWAHVAVVILVSVCFGIAASLAGLFLNDLSTRRYMRGADLFFLIVAAVVENCGYRQVNSWWSCVGTVRTLTRRGAWGTMKRRAFEGQKLGLLVAVLVTAAVGTGAGQDDVIAKARAAATSGQRGEALHLLEAHLAQTPRDVDARLLYGLVLSWEGRYDAARRVLQQVLTQAPSYTDARVALMNVEYWSGHPTEALSLATEVLAGQPGNATARAVRERIEASTRPWWATSSYRVDSFSDDDTQPWQEFTLYVTRRTRVGSLIVRGNHAARFDTDDQLLEIELYPRFRPGTYAFLSAGFANEATLYPTRRFAVDLYQSLGWGLEVSAGARQLEFDTTTRIYVGTLTKYLGNWMFTGKVYYVPGEGPLNSTSYHGGFRRYFGGDGTSYAGLKYSHGFSQEIRNVVDLAMLNSDTIVGEFDILFGARLRLFGSAGTSREERVDLPPLWQTTITSGLSVQF
jgi:YaiO family outer membrane protein